MARINNEQFKFFKHTADAKFQAFGKTKEEAFANAAIAMFSVMTDTSKVNCTISKEISAQGIDHKSLLYHFLEELLFLLDSENFLLHKVECLQIKGNKLTAKVTGDAASQKYETHGDVKAVTYNEMEIKKKKGRWIVQVVVDV
ncbi:archease [archaeon]|nr:archease [archaeon]